MYYSYYYPYQMTSTMHHDGFLYIPDGRNQSEYYEVNPEDQRFFPLFGLLPFAAGLVIGPLLFNGFNNRPPCCPPPYPAPYPYPQAYPAAPAYPPPYQMASLNQTQQATTPVYGGITENVNIYTK
ncbi:MAG: hypothetical protein ACI35R_03365 [Bacillus sp. (in: firmicutes)]